MSDPVPYVVDGVTVTPQAGGYYQLSHDSLDAAVRVRGKEVADARAMQIAAAAQPPEGAMDAQGPLPDVLPAGDTDVADLKALVAAQSAQIAALLARPATTVLTDGEDEASIDPLATVPRAFAGQVDKATRKAMAKLGVEYKTIVLEEGNDIPPTGLFISHNGRGYMIKPGEPVDVPDFLLGILDNAVMSSPVVDSTSQKVLGYRDRSRYPYRLV